MLTVLALLWGLVPGAVGLGSNQAWYHPNQTAFLSKVASLERGDLHQGKSALSGAIRKYGFADERLSY